MDHGEIIVGAIAGVSAFLAWWAKFHSKQVNDAVNNVHGDDKPKLYDIVHDIHRKIDSAIKIAVRNDHRLDELLTWKEQELKPFICKTQQQLDDLTQKEQKK